MTAPRMDVPGIYRITDAHSGRFYIGSSVNVAKRWVQHCWRLDRGAHTNPMLQAIWNVDPARLSILLLQETKPTRDDLLRCEQQAIDAALATGACMNVLRVAGSHLGRKRSPETRARLAAAQRGKKASDETRAKLRAAKLGRPLTEAHRRKVGDAARGRKLPPRAYAACPERRRFSAEQVLAMRAAKTQGDSFSKIEKAFGISRGALQRMLQRQTYKDVI